jgi:competence protein ComGF
LVFTERRASGDQDEVGEEIFKRISSTYFFSLLECLFNLYSLEKSSTIWVTLFKLSERFKWILDTFGLQEQKSNINLLAKVLKVIPNPPQMT